MTTGNIIYHIMPQGNSHMPLGHHLIPPGNSQMPLGTFSSYGIMERPEAIMDVEHKYVIPLGAIVLDTFVV